MKDLATFTKISCAKSIQDTVLFFQFRLGSGHYLFGGGIGIRGGIAILTIFRSAIKGGHGNFVWKMGHDTHRVDKMIIWDYNTVFGR